MRPSCTTCACATCSRLLFRELTRVVVSGGERANGVAVPSRREMRRRAQHGRRKHDPRRALQQCFLSGAAAITEPTSVSLCWCALARHSSMVHSVFSNRRLFRRRCFLLEGRDDTATTQTSHYEGVGAALSEEAEEGVGTSSPSRCPSQAQAGETRFFFASICLSSSFPFARTPSVFLPAPPPSLRFTMPTSNHGSADRWMRIERLPTHTKKNVSVYRSRIIKS